MPWTVPRMWDGRTVAILASGPSMSHAVADAIRAAGVPTIAVNSTFRLAPWADMLYAADPEWWQHETNRDAMAFAGLRVSCMAVPGVLRLRHTGSTGFDPDPGAVRTGGNSGYQALHVAVHAGAAKILLCGYDMGEPGGESHWHGHHPHGLRDTPEPTYARWCARFADLAPILKARGVDVVNVTIKSALHCFRASTLAAELPSRPQVAAKEQECVRSIC